VTAEPPPLFEGLRVLELGQYVAAPYCAELFAHGGADVVKVEPITGDETRFNSEIVFGEGRQYIIKARGKRGIAVDLGHAEGRALCRRLALAADVVVSNFRPGVAARLGLDYDTLAAEQPRLIYGEITAFGYHGPLGGRPGIDIVTQAATGLMVSNRGVTDDGRPAYSEAFLSDYMSAVLLAFGITAALRQRDRTGRGQKVTTTLMQAALALQHGSANVFDAVDGWKRAFVSWLDHEQPSFAAAVQRRTAALASNQVHYNTYDTADGVIAVGAPAALRRRFLEAIGVDDPRYSEPGWRLPDDPRPYIADLTARARAAVRGRRTDELLADLQARGIPCARVTFPEQALLGEQARANGFVTSADHPRVGPMTLPAAPVQFSAARYEAAGTSPAYGEHTRAVLADLGLSPAEVERLIAERVVGDEGGLPPR
jgi:CoA:oxalate CoA-transferase